MSALACLLLLHASANAHPFHASTTEVEWNAKSERFEVAMKLRIVDLEDAISLQQGRRFRLEHSDNLKLLLQNYLQQHFSITFAEHAMCELTWIGHELELHDVWVYFEARSVAGDQEQNHTDVTTVASENPVSMAQTAPGSFRKSADEISRKLTWDELMKSARLQPARLVRIRSSMLMDVQPEQVNLVILTVQNTVLSATFNASQFQTTLKVPGTSADR